MITKTLTYICIGLAFFSGFFIATHESFAEGDISSDETQNNTYTNSNTQGATSSNTQGAISQSNVITSPNFSISPCDLNPLSTGNCGSTPTAKGAINYVLTKISELLLYFVPIIAGISFIIAGYYYILSSGDSEKASQAKTIIKWNIVSICVAFLSFVLIKLLAWLITI